MPATAPSGVQHTCLVVEPKRALLTPSASPSVGPPDRPPAKRPRLRSTPSSSISTTPSMSNESTSSADFNSARRASTLRVLNSWAQLAERYNKRLDEDDIVDLYSGAIIKNRGVLKSAPRDYHIGHFAQPEGDQEYPDADQDQEDSEQDEDENELSALPSEATTDDDAPISKKELLRGVPPLSATTDAEDLREFLEAERRRRGLAGDEEEEDDMSPEQLSAIRKAVEEESQKREAAFAEQIQDAAGTERHPEGEVDTTPTRSATRVPLSEDESEDELALWTHDESTAVYPVGRDESEQDVQKVEQDVIELTESDSDEEFEAILTRPPRLIRVSPPPTPHTKEVQPPLYSPPDSGRGRSKSRIRSSSKAKLSKVTPKSESRPRSPLMSRKPEDILAHKGGPSVQRETCTTTSDDGGSDQEAVGRISLARRGKGKDTPPLEDGHREKTPKALGIASRGRKRKRIASSSASVGPLTQSPAPKSSLRSHRKSISQRSAALPQSAAPPTLGTDVSTPARFECNVAGPSRSSPSFASASKTKQPNMSAPAYRPLELESAQPTLYDHHSDRLLPDPPIPVTHACSRRHPSHPPSIFSSPNQGTPGLSLPTHPSPMDPVQTQHAHYLLAQAMHQLSYLISATMPPYAAYASNSGQSWHPPSHTAYNTPVHPPSHFHGTRPYHTPSSSISRSDLPPSSPVHTSVSLPAEEPRARSRGRSKSRGRRVSFKLDSGEVVGNREHNIQPEPDHAGQKIRGQPLEVQREKGKGKAAEEFDDSSRIEERDSPPQELTRGRTPGPPNRKKIDVSRGRSLSRR